MESKYDNYAQGGSGGQDYDNVELRPTPNNMIEGDLVRVFGTDSNYGDSLGVVFENTALVDGGLYLDPEKGLYKSFSWKEMTGYTIAERVDDGEEPSADDAPEVLPKTYGDTQKRYELVAARVPESDEVDASSRARDYEIDDGSVEYEDFVDMEGEPVEFGSIIMWHNGSDDYGANATSLRLAEVLTQQGDDIVADPDDIYGWLAVTNGENILREELEGRRVRFFIVRRPSQDSDRMYNYPVLEDVKTGEPIERSHSSDEGESGN